MLWIERLLWLFGGIFIGMAIFDKLKRRTETPVSVKSSELNTARKRAEQFVRRTWPNASCFEARLYWPNQGTRKRWIVISSPIMSRPEAEGITESEAWLEAAIRLMAKARARAEAALEKTLSFLPRDGAENADMVATMENAYALLARSKMEGEGVEEITTPITEDPETTTI